MWGVGGTLYGVLPTARYARGDYFVVCDRFAWSSCWSARILVASSSERHAKPNTHHEVVAARAGRFFYAFAVFLMLGLNIGHHCYGHYTHHGTRGAAAQFTQH